MGTCCVKTTSSSTVEMPEGTSISQFHFTDVVVGQGAFSTVYKCLNPQGLPVAIKCVRLSELQGDLHQLHREVHILKQVHHPHVLTYLCSFHDPEHLYIVTELCSGGNLFDKIEQGAVEEREMKRVARELLEGLAYLHALHICHRDLKPENVLFTEKGEAKIADFGLARVLDQSRIVSVVGTPYYLAPEVPDGKYDLKCDIWSLGVLLFYGLVGKLPFAGKDWPELRNNVLSSHIDDWGKVTEEGKTFLLRLLRIDPKERLSASESLQEKWLSQYG